MSIASEISRLQSAKADIIDAIEDKGVTVPSGSTLDDFADLVEAIQTGGGGGGKYIEGSYTPAAATKTFAVSVNFQPKYAYAFVTNWRELTHTSWLTGSVVGALNGSYQRGRLLTRINSGTYGSTGNVLNDTFFTYSNGILTFDTASNSYIFPAGGVIEWFAAGDGGTE